MALKLTGLTFVILILFYGRSQNGVNTQSTESPSISPLFKYGVQHGDEEVADPVQPIALSFNISFLGFNYRQIYISPDGTVGFKKLVDYRDEIKYYGGVRNPSTDVPFVAPLLYKAYRPFKISSTDYQGKITYRLVDYKNGQNAAENDNIELRNNLLQYLPQTVVNSPINFDIKFLVLVTWENVAEGPESGTRTCGLSDHCNSTTFQIALAGDDANTFAIFNYEKLDISGTENYEAGLNAGAGRGWFDVLPCHGGCSRDLKDPLKNLPKLQGSDLRGRYIFSVGQETVVRGGCLAKELVSGILERYPRTVGMLGGEKLEVSGQCAAPGATFYCRFGTARDAVHTVPGVMVNFFKGYCPVPLLYTTGRIDIYWSNETRIWTAYGSVNVVLPSRLGDPVVIDKSVEEAWYKRDSSEITVRWDSAKFSRDGTINVDIKLFGYKENSNGIEYKELKTFGSARNNQNSFTFNVKDHRCTQNCEEFEIGVLEASLAPQYYSQATERVAVRFGPIAIGWYVNEDLVSRRGSDWSDQKCREWNAADSKNTQWLADLLPCPCSLDQALADFGRWQADPGCNLFTGSACHYHKGAKHCVRSVVPTKDGAGNQCCYNTDGTLRHSQLSHEGSTPDRSHAWGASPYNQPDRVPEFSHFKHDVVSFYYCCLWNSYQLCDLYMERRPTADCRNYDVPGVGFIHGLTHIKTFDGLTYHLAAAGDFWLVQYNDISLIIQGKFESWTQSWDLGKLTKTSSWYPKALTAIAMSAGREKIEVILTPEDIRPRRAIDIRVDGELKFFLDKPSFWQDFEEFAVINNAASEGENRHNNFTFLLNKFSVGVNVVAVNGLLQVAVAVPPQYKPQPGQKPNILGLLGAYDESPDDFYTRNGTVIPTTTDKRTIFEKFVLSWKLTPDDYGIFKFENIAGGVDPQHTYLDYRDIPTNFPEAPAPSAVNQVCGSSENCRWDYQISGEETLARSSREAETWFGNLQRSAYRVDSCGLPALGPFVVLNSENFSVTRDVGVVGCRNGNSPAEGTTFRCSRKSAGAARSNDIIRTDKTNRERYVVHWDPLPYTICANAVNGESNLPLIIGVAVGAAVLVIVIVVVVVVVIRKKRSGKSSQTEKKTTAEKRKKGVETDPAAAEAMLARVEGRSPIYKPSEEPVRMSEIKGGSNV